MALVVIAGSLVILGCDGSEENRVAVEAADVENRSFVFADGAAFGIDAGLEPVILTFGDFTGTVGPFRLEAGEFSATGEATLGSCTLQVNIGNFPPGQGPQAGTRITLNPCDINRDTGALTVTNASDRLTATSASGQTAQNPPGGVGILTTPSRSTSIALTADDRRLMVVNRETHSLAVIEVRDQSGNDIPLGRRLAEVAVGQEPRCVAVSPDDREAYVTNTVSGTVSVIPLLGTRAFGVVAEIPVGTEPRGCAVTPNGTQLYVANHTAGTVSVIDVLTRTVTATINVGGNPTAIAITNDGDTADNDERVFVTDFYAELIPGRVEVFDDAKQGIVRTFTTANPTVVTSITLSPLANSGFTANRSAFCPQSTTITLQSTAFCPDLAAAAGSSTITSDPQGVFPNQLQAALIRNNLLYLPNIGAQPEPPVRFNVNVQALVYVVDTTQLAEQTTRHVNLNQQVVTERVAGNTTGINGLFGNDLVAIDANRDGSVFLVVSRGGNYVFRGSLDADGRLTLGAPNIIRYQTGNIPNGVVVSKDGRRAYTNNEVGVSVTAINLDTNQVITRDIDAGEPPNPGTFAHSVLVGKLVFFTALGTPDNGLFDTPIRSIVPLDSRGKASDNAWSDCGSCHPDGLADGVTWIFATGPRQTVPLDAFFAKDNPADQRISNWSAVMGSITDFNNNSRGVQGGCGFASDAFRGSAACTPTAPANPEIFQHGITQGASDALDAMTTWVQTVRAPILPQPSDTAALAAGQTVFQTNCASCHGGAKWTKSQVLYADNPAFTANPAAGGVPRDPGVNNTGAQIVSYTVGGNTLVFLENVGTFDAADPVEIRSDGTQALGSLGFNVPSLLGVGYHAPYLHNGEAQTLDEVFALHALGAAGTINTALSATDRQNLLVFLNAIDGRTDALRSQGDTFRDALSP